MKDKQIISYKEEELIRCFNKRERQAFEKIYALLYHDLYYFTTRLCRNSELVTQDVLQDLFMKLWGGKRIDFTSLEHLKAYLYTSIRNYFREYYSHKQVESKYQKMIKNDDDHVASCLVETEVISELSRLPDLFSAECAKVLKLYLEGWDIKDIAGKLGKSQSTIYTQRQEIIAILKKVLSRQLFSIFLLFSLSSKK